MDVHRARAPAVGDRGCSGSDGARSRRERLTDASLPHADGEIVRAVDTYELHVRAVREAWVPFEQRPETQELVAVRIATDHGMWIAHRDGRELQVLAAGIDCLRLPHVGTPGVEDDEVTVDGG